MNNNSHGKKQKVEDYRKDFKFSNNKTFVTACNDRWWYSKITPPGYKWKPKTSSVNVKPNVSVPLARRDNFVHRRLWVLKAHDGKSQASN
ncbi:hypothetical protein Tco_1272939 [Tanacetum coccineum]